ncbi:MAG: hypothetical protein QG673_1348 [Pseudomonadota bacterium]|nr:hypothetical protein [Pseudomonadota bacterium]
MVLGMRAAKSKYVTTIIGKNFLIIVLMCNSDTIDTSFRLNVYL